jgi:DNA-directed RNA polymerase specialized sigma subunit
VSQPELLKELQTIRALLMLTILKIEGTTEEIAAALDVSNQRISQMIPASKIKKLKIESDLDLDE